MTKPIVRDLESVQRLKSLKKEHGFSLSQLADHLKLNKGLVIQVLSGRVAYSAKVRAALGLDPLPSWRVDPDSIPRSRHIGGGPRQCPECVALYEEGELEEPDTWWWYGNTSRVYCSAAHGRAWRKREKTLKGVRVANAS